MTIPASTRALIFAFGCLAIGIAAGRYETNDDLSLIWTLSGGDGFPSDPFLLFTGFAWNRSLHALYAAWPFVPWWGILSLSAAFAGALLSASVLFRIGSTAWAFLLPLAALLIHSFSSHSITLATLLLEAGALLCLGEVALRGTVPARRPRLYLLGIGACLAISLGMRRDIAPYFLILGLPLLALPKPGTLSKILPPLLLAFGVGTADRVAARLQATPEEREFASFNVLRSRFHDTPAGAIGPGFLPALDKAGWSEADYRFFRNWAIYDDSLFNRNSLKAFLEANPAPDPGIQGRLQNALAAKKPLLLYFLVLVLAGLIFVPGLRLSTRSRKVHTALVVSIHFAALLFLLEYRFVSRVYVPLLVLSLVGLLSMLRAYSMRAASDYPSRSRRGLILLIAAAVPALSLVWIFQVLQTAAPGREERRFIDSCLDRFEPKIPNLVLLDAGPGLRLESFHPLRAKTLSPGLRLFPNGVDLYSPRTRRILNSMGMRNGRGLLRSWIENPDFAFVLHSRDTAAEPEMVSAWEGYYRRHFPASRMKLEPIFSCREESESLEIYRMAAARP